MTQGTKDTCLSCMELWEGEFVTEPQTQLLFYQHTTVPKPSALGSLQFASISSRWALRHKTQESTTKTHILLEHVEVALLYVFS